MDNPDFPGNSNQSRQGGEPKKVEQIVTSQVRRESKSIGRRLKETLFGGDSKTAFQYILSDVVVPQVKDMLADAATQGFHRMIFGDDRPARRSASRTSGYTAYNRYSQRGNNPIGRQREERPRAQMRREEFDDLVFETRDEAGAVLEKMYDMLDEYKLVSVADLNSMIGETPKHTDHKWGWEDLQGSHIKMVRDGYLLILPKTIALD